MKIRLNFKYYEYGTVFLILGLFSTHKKYFELTNQIPVKHIHRRRITNFQKFCISISLLVEYKTYVIFRKIKHTIAIFIG